MPAADATPSDTVENDTLAVHRQRSAVMADPFYDANRFFGVVLNVQGPDTDHPVAVTRVNYADASDLHAGAVTWQAYAPFSLVPLWNNQGRADRVIYGGTAAPGQTALCVDPGTQYRCAFPGIDWGEFPYLRSGQDAHTWQGTVMVDKPDATGTYYRRNRSYDPSTARFTQEDPLGLAGGLNVYGFAGGDPVNFSDPFGLHDCHIVECPKSTKFFAESKQIRQLAKDLLVASKADGGREYGAQIVREKDGKLKVVNVRRGEEGEIRDPRPDPKNTVAEIHTHPDQSLDGGGKITFDFPSGDDAVRANSNHVYGVIVTPRVLLVIPVDKFSYDTYKRR